MTKARKLADLGNVYDDGALSNRNLIINGAMQVAQRGTSETGVSGNGYKTVDRFEYHAQGSMTGEVTMAQVSDAPEGFKNSVKLTVTTTDTYAAGEYVALPQYIEGYNIIPLGMGATGAKSFTVSFWVKASVTGEYAIAFQNNDNSRNFMHTYDVDAANTWEYKTMTIPADTSGTWPTSNSTGLKVWISLGTGSTYAESATLSSWQSSLVLGSTNGVKLLENSGATFQITGVQLEVGDTATPFEHRSYGDELARCQRYYYRWNAETTHSELCVAASHSSTSGIGNVVFPVTMRSAPTSGISSSAHFHYAGNASIAITGTTFAHITRYNTRIGCSTAGSLGTNSAYRIRAFNTTSAWAEFDAEL